MQWRGVQASRPVPGQPVGHPTLLAIPLNSNDMHLLRALAGVVVDPASICLKFRSYTDAAGYGAARSNLSHHVVLTSHLSCKGTQADLVGKHAC